LGRVESSFFHIIRVVSGSSFPILCVHVHLLFFKVLWLFIPVADFISGPVGGQLAIRIFSLRSAGLGSHVIQPFFQYFGLFRIFALWFGFTFLYTSPRVSSPISGAFLLSNYNLMSYIDTLDLRFRFIVMLMGCYADGLIEKLWDLPLFPKAQKENYMPLYHNRGRAIYAL